tara:strand:- start:6930 stop:7106 length:177 start_codon:yes stop_codon:yes gene_type:complete
MNEQDKQFLACLCVWLDWSIYQSVQSVDSTCPDDRSFEMIRLQAKELVKEFSKPVEDK